MNEIPGGGDGSWECDRTMGKLKIGGLWGTVCRIRMENNRTVMIMEKKENKRQ